MELGVHQYMKPFLFEQKKESAEHIQVLKCVIMKLKPLELKICKTFKLTLHIKKKNRDISKLFRIHHTALDICKASGDIPLLPPFQERGAANQIRLS